MPRYGGEGSWGSATYSPFFLTRAVRSIWSLLPIIILSKKYNKKQKDVEIKGSHLAKHLHLKRATQFKRGAQVHTHTHTHTHNTHKYINIYILRRKDSFKIEFQCTYEINGTVFGSDIRFYSTPVAIYYLFAIQLFATLSVRTTSTFVCVVHDRAFLERSKHALILDIGMHFFSCSDQKNYNFFFHSTLLSLPPSFSF